MPSPSLTRTTVATPLLAVLSAALMLGACTRDPFDRSRPVLLFEDDFDYSVIIPSADIRSFTVASDGAGHRALAIANGSHGITVKESAASVWTDAGSITSSGLNGEMVDLAAGPMGSWWVLASDSGVGMRLFRVGGAGDSSLTIPKFQNAEWDSLGAVLTSDLGGHPVAYLIARGLQMIRATLADTGWAFTEIPLTTATAMAWDAVVTADGTEHLVFRRTSVGASFYQRISTDSTHTSEVPNSGGLMAITATPANVPYLAGPMADYLSLRLWKQEDDLYTWNAEVLPASNRQPVGGHFAVALAADGTPYVLWAFYNDTERISVVMSSRSPDVYNLNWSADSVAEDIPWRGSTDRRNGFRILLDDLDRPMIFFLSAAADEVDSALYVAVLRD
jgi:hypothetical protein